MPCPVLEGDNLSRAVRRWIEWYNDERPHQALGYLSPRPYRALQLQRVA